MGVGDDAVDKGRHAAGARRVRAEREAHLAAGYGHLRAFTRELRREGEGGTFFEATNQLMVFLLCLSVQKTRVFAIF